MCCLTARRVHAGVASDRATVRVALEVTCVTRVLRGGALRYLKAREKQDFGFERDWERDLSRFLSECEKTIEVRTCAP